METLLYRLDSAAWYARTDEYEKQFTKRDAYGDPYEMFTYDVVNDLIGLPRNFGAPEIAQSVGFKYSDGYQWADGFVPKDDEQERLVADMVHVLSKKMGAILEAPTGYGKTYLGSAIIQRIGQKACVITTKQDIMKDWRKALSEVLSIPESDVHMWHGDKEPGEDAQAVVALVQSVCKGYDRYPKEMYEQFGLVMVDEVHRMGADEFSKAMWHFPARYRVGLSATPYRRDGKEKVFHAHIGQVEVSTEVKTLPFKVILKQTGWQVPKVWQWNPEKKRKQFDFLNIPWDRAILAVKHLQDDPDRNDIIFQFCKSALKKGRNTVIFSDTVEHLTAIQLHLIANGIPEEKFGYYVGLQNPVYKLPQKEQPKNPDGTTTGYRELLRTEHATRPIVLATYKMCSEATNKPWWDTAVLATAKSDVVQIVGRILREYPGKPTPVVLDLIDGNHKVFATFAKKRRKWYESQNTEIVIR